MLSIIISGEKVNFFLTDAPFLRLPDPSSAGLFRIGDVHVLVIASAAVDDAHRLWGPEDRSAKQDRGGERSEQALS